MTEVEALKGLHMVSAGGPGAVGLKDGRLHWVVARNDRNVFRGIVALPPGVVAENVAALACDGMQITVVTKRGDVHVYSRSSKAWVARASLIADDR